MNWNEDLSPWEANRVLGNQDHFTGDAPAYLDWLLSVVVPLAQHELGEYYGEAYISGYSLAGLFALWSLYQTDIFKGAACVSGSL
ncbi:alpha/beta hydrolase-fold protein [Olegusella massiliensis]|uniref:alpha/beta hydrolase-fold protein n=1 Tax=Olegusella massiliensis TaxID=1776381 RepID=UPI003C6E08C2